MESRMTSVSPSSPTSSYSSSRSTSPNPPSLLSPPSLPPAVPALVLRKLVASELLRTGFESAESEAVEFLEGALFTFFGSLLQYAHGIAELGRRHEPTLEDVIIGCREMGVANSARELLDELKKETTPLVEEGVSVRYSRPSRTGNSSKDLAFLPSDDEASAFPEPEEDPSLLSPPPSPPRSDAASGDSDSDDSEDAFEEVVPLGADGQPIPGAKEAKIVKKKEKEKKKVERSERKKERERRRKAREFRRNELGGTFEAEWAPKLPPKHSWKQTPVFPEQPAPPPIPAPVSLVAQSPSPLALAHLSTLRSRLNDSQLVASSLRNLIRRTGASARGGTNSQSQSQSLILLSSSAAEDSSNPNPNPEAQAQAQALEVAAEQEADLVSYENEWYGPKAISRSLGRGAKKGKRSVRTIRVGSGGMEEDSEGDEEREREEGTIGGGVAKRRRWLV